MENTSERPNWNVVLPWHDYRVHNRLGLPDELDMAASLAGLRKAKRLKAPLDLTEGLAAYAAPTSTSTSRTWGGRAACGGSK